MTDRIIKSCACLMMSVFLCAGCGKPESKVTPDSAIPEEPSTAKIVVDRLSGKTALECFRKAEITVKEANLKESERDDQIRNFKKQ